MIRKTTVFKKRKFIRNFLLINNHFKRFILKYFINLIHFNNLIWRENCIFWKNRWFPGISGTPEVPKYRRCTAPIDYLWPPKKFGPISCLSEKELQNKCFLQWKKNPSIEIPIEKTPIFTYRSLRSEFFVKIRNVESVFDSGSKGRLNFLHQ